MEEVIQSKIDFIYDDENESSIAERVLKPEILSTNKKRANLNIKRNNNVLSLQIIAKDLTALRSTVNTYIRWIKIINDLLKLKGGE
ncbi:MAG: KEOPS complex subunit Pcc1 [Candidatus Odinarchaeia archaeon]